MKQGLSRRSAVSGLAGMLVTSPSILLAARSKSSVDSAVATFASKLQTLQRQGTAIDAMRADRTDRLALQSGLEHAPIEAAPSSTSIDPRASELIVACEVGGRQRYTHKYQSPTWPAGDSGITIGIGYDIGYETVDQLKRDWDTFLSVGELEKLSEACGITAVPAKQLLMSMPPILVGWTAASQQYFQKTQPRYVGETEHALPNCALLNATCLGALVSLVYNRGNSFSIPQNRDPTNRFTEMRNIKQHMVSKQFNQIPVEIRSMKRLWVNQVALAGLVARRELEAQLFEIGLAQN